MKLRIPKRIRLGLPQRPHGKRGDGLYSFQREWLEAREASFLASAWAKQRERMAEIAARPADSLLDRLDNQMDAAMSGILFSLQAQTFYNVDLDDMPRDPP